MKRHCHWDQYTTLNYVDITTDLDTKVFNPYRKPEDRTLYMFTPEQPPTFDPKEHISGKRTRTIRQLQAKEQIFRSSRTEKMCVNRHKATIKTNIKKVKEGQMVHWYNPPYCMKLAISLCLYKYKYLICLIFYGMHLRKGAIYGRCGPWIS